MRELLSVLKALADESRLRIVCALGLRELCVCQITELLRLAPSTVSRHVAVLQHAGLVESRKCGRWIYYRLPPPENAPQPVRRALEWTREVAVNSEHAKEDVRRVKEILRMDASALCRMQTVKGARARRDRPAARVRRAGRRRRRPGERS